MLYKRLRELRERKGVLQAEVARHLNITREAYSMYETNKRHMNYETLCRLADYYEVSTDYLLGRQIAVPSFLNEDERELIDLYRSIDEYVKEGIRNTLKFEYKRARKKESPDDRQRDLH